MQLLPKRQLLPKSNINIIHQTLKSTRFILVDEVLVFFFRIVQTKKYEYLIDHDHFFLIFLPGHFILIFDDDKSKIFFNRFIILTCGDDQIRF